MLVAFDLDNQIFQQKSPPPSLPLQASGRTPLSTIAQSESDIAPILEKSAKDSNLKKVYFLHSSSESETSLATQNYSFFTYSFLESLTQGLGQIRYRDIMAFVADGMAAQGLPKPVFVVQADNTEIFGTIEADLIEFAKSKLAVKGSLTDDATTQIEPSTDVEDELLQLVMAKSSNEFCTRNEAESNLATIKELFSHQRWPKNVLSLFDLELNEIENPAHIANAEAIGNWLKKYEADNYFATPRYEVLEYEVEEYRELPRKPTSSRSIAMTARTFGMLYGDGDKEYKLEKVKKTRDVVRGFHYTSDSPFKAARLYFKPKHTALETYSLTVVTIFSRKSAVLFHSTEHLVLNNWESLQEPKSKEWKSKTALLKVANEIKNAIDAIVADTSSFILSDVKARLGK